MLKLSEVVSPAYKEFFKTDKTYVICKGSRGSGKSKSASLWIILNMMRYPLANTLVVRKVERTLRDSCYADLRWAIDRLGVEAYWKCTTNPLEITYIPTGQKILFRGLDDPLKVTSISVPNGVLCWLFIEEAFEITSEDDFDMLDASIRGIMPDGYFKRVMMCLNPWSERHWIKKRFYDSHADNVLAMTTTYLDNPWLSDIDRKWFDDMRKRNPRKAAVACDGNWGIVEGLVYENWKEEAFEFVTQAEYEEAEEKTGLVIRDNLISAFGLDFGYTNDPTALFCGLLDKQKKQLFVFDEMYQKGMSNRKIAEEIKAMGYGKERITADSAEPKSIDELIGLGLRVKAAKKGKDSIQNGIQWIQDLEIIIHPRCVNFLTEISNYTWDKDKFGTKLNVPIDDFNHLMDAMRYALEGHIAKKGWLV